jgi:hypothetical protein
MATRTVLRLQYDGRLLVFSIDAPDAAALHSEHPRRLWLRTIDSLTGEYDELEIDPASVVHRSGVEGVELDDDVTAVIPPGQE